MKIHTRLALHSAWNRRFSLGLMLLAIALSSLLLLGIERVRHQVRDSFLQSVSGTDLIVGARSSPVQLMLYAIFHLGGVSNNMSWDSAQKLARDPAVAWTIPLSLGDSHQGFPVLATNSNYFKYFRYGNGHSLRFTEGRQFNDIFETVLGADVAHHLHYRIGDRIVLSHGIGDTHSHADKPFVVTAILARTGTPVDRTLHISLEAMEAIHLEWEGGAPLPGLYIAPQLVKKFDLTPKNITAVLIGLKNRTGVFAFQRQIDNAHTEPLMAVLPGVTLDDLWHIVGVAENGLLAVSAMVIVIGLAGLISTILASLHQRRRELAVLRSVGAHALDIFLLLSLEGCAVMLIGVGLGVLLLSLSSLLFGSLLASYFGITLPLTLPGLSELQLLAWILLAGFAASLLPGWHAYRLSLSDGLTPRI